MKKTYLMPTVSEHKLQMRPIMAVIGSPVDISLGEEAPIGITDPEIGSKSIWDDTMGDGFNW